MSEFFTAFESLEDLADEGGKYYRLSERPSGEDLKGELAYVFRPDKGGEDVLAIRESDLKAEVRLDFWDHGDWATAVAALDRAGFATRALDLAGALDDEVSCFDAAADYDMQALDEAVLRAVLDSEEDEPEAYARALCELDGLELIGYTDSVGESGELVVL